MEHAAIPLSPLGIAQATALAEAFDGEVSRVLTSSYVRAIDTAAPLCARFGLQPEIHPLLHEFSALDSDQLCGMTQAERRPLADAYWATTDPEVRMGPKAETFLEFAARVEAFLPKLSRLPDSTVLVGHGIWFGLLFWRLSGFTAEDSPGMAAFRRFQSRIPMANCIVYELHRPRKSRRWDMRVDEDVTTAISRIGVVV